jgi:hypothetical protein
MTTIQQASRLFANKNKSCRLDWPEYNPQATGEWIRTQSGLPWLQLDVTIPTEHILKEVLAIKDYFVDHRTDYSEHTSWRSFCIHGKSYNATREDDYYNDNRPHTWTDVATRLMPNTVEFFKTQWPLTEYSRLRVMELAPGGIISVHRDGDFGKIMRPINIAITQPAECDFCMEGYGTVPFETGSSYLLNVTNRHTVINNSNQYRYHIIIHHPNIERLDSLILKSYNKSYAS